ncbi:MAG: hypothetical protein KKB21_03885 [Nanoarchaeota archaeon]|nr:hypothetical protein [Nanoarchaeota archaeon]MBU4086688.1 hypothetical protein [Nanoarchaeota archaeon]
MNLVMLVGGVGFNFGDFLNTLETYGFFAYVLPFLLIFALVYAILAQIKMFQDNRGAAVIVSLAVGLLSLQLGFVSTFFQTIFPRFGIALSIVLVAMILAGAFLMDSEKGKKAYPWIFFGLGGLVFLFVLISSLADWSFYGGGNWRFWWDQYAGLVIFLLLLVGVIVAVSMGNKNKP